MSAILFYHTIHQRFVIVLRGGCCAFQVDERGAYA